MQHKYYDLTGCELLFSSSFALLNRFKRVRSHASLVTAGKLGVVGTLRFRLRRIRKGMQSKH